MNFSRSIILQQSSKMSLHAIAHPVPVSHPVSHDGHIAVQSLDNGITNPFPPIPVFPPPLPLPPGLPGPIIVIPPF